MNKNSKTKSAEKVRLPRKSASYRELDEFLYCTDAVALLKQGVTEIDSDRSDLVRMLEEYWKEVNSKQLSIRIPVTAKRIIEMLAKRKMIEVSTLVRMWVIECMRREANQPQENGGKRHSHTWFSGRTSGTGQHPNLRIAHRAGSNRDNTSPWWRPQVH